MQTFPCVASENWPSADVALNALTSSLPVNSILVAGVFTLLTAVQRTKATATLATTTPSAATATCPAEDVAGCRHTTVALLLRYLAQCSIGQ